MQSRSLIILLDSTTVKRTNLLSSLFNWSIVPDEQRIAILSFPETDSLLFGGAAHLEANNSIGAAMISLSRLYTIFFLLTTLFAVEGAQAYTLDWGALTWSPRGSLHHVYNNVDGSTVNVDINVTGDTGRFLNNYPRKTSYGLSSFTNYRNHSESVTFTYTFSQPVIIQNFSILDIDGITNSWGDGVIITARTESGATIAPNNVTFGSNINQISPSQYESNGLASTFTTDPRGRLSFNFDTQPVTQFSIVHYPSSVAAPNPGASAMTLTNFDFFYVSDFGDAAGYGTARHIRHFSEPWLGSNRGDADLNAPQTNADADADDTNGSDDEDGVSFRSPHGGDHAEIYADMQVVNDTGGDVYACAWLDRWDGTGTPGGSFDAGDRANSPTQFCQTVPDNGGTATTTTFYWNGLPEASGHTYARFRVCANLAECQHPTGDATGGEVEDYRIDFDFNPTLAVIDNFRVNVMDSRAVSEITGLANNVQDKPVAVVQWDTAQEHGTVGFYVERKTINDTTWQRINGTTMLPGLITAPQGGEYLLLDPEASPQATYLYRLVEEEIWNTRKIYGPWLIDLASPKAAPARQGSSLQRQHLKKTGKSPWRRLARNFVGRARAEAQKTHLAPINIQHELLAFHNISGAPSQKTRAKKRRVNRVRFRTREQGMYRVTLDELAAVTSIPAPRIADKILNGKWSFSVGGNSAAYYYDVERQEFVFAAETWLTTETRDNIYRLGKFRRHRGWNMDRLTGPGPEAGLPDQFREHLSFAEDNMLLTWVHQEENADYGYWDYIFPPRKPAAALTINLPDPAAVSANPGHLKIVLRGAGDLVPGNDHLARVSLNGTPLAGEVKWDGNRQAVLETSFDQRILGGTEAGETVAVTVTVEGEALNSARYSLVYIESVAIDYDRKMYAREDSLRLHDAPSGVVSVSGFSGPEIRVIENPGTAEALWREDITVTETVDGFQVSFETAGGEEYQLSSAPMNIPAEADLPSRLLSRRNRAEYLIIAPDTLLQSAQALADHRKNTFTTRLIRLQDIYDVFSYGRVDSTAIQLFLQYVYRHWQQVPQYVILMGRGTLDHADQKNLGESQLPLKMAATPWGLIGSDNRYADIDGDHLPEYAIGRIAVSDDLQGMIYVNKLQAYEAQSAGDWSSHAVVAADNPDPKAGDFYVNSDETASTLADFGYSVETLYHPAQNIHDTLLTEWNAGQLGLVNYNGHGGRTQLGAPNEIFLNNDDAQSLGNGNHLPFFIALTCAAGDSSYPGTLSLGDTLSLHEGGGSIASFVPTGLSLDAPAHQLNQALIRAVIDENQSIGKAAQQALQTLKAQGSPDFMLDLYTTSGDPAVQVIH